MAEEKQADRPMSDPFNTDQQPLQQHDQLREEKQRQKELDAQRKEHNQRTSGNS